MGTIIITSREFNQDVSNAKREALKGPVFITDRGQPSHVLLSIETWQKIAHADTGIVELLAMPDGADIDFDAPQLNRPQQRPADLAG